MSITLPPAIDRLITEALAIESEDAKSVGALGFMAELGMVPTGGRWGSITRLKKQMQRLFASSVSCTYDDGASWALESVKPVDSARLWWEPRNPDQAAKKTLPEIDRAVEWR